MVNLELCALESLPAGWRAAVEAALAARERAYAPYSHFAVGAAVCTASGQLFAGCNVENASYGLTVCAERVAVWRAVAAGERRFALLAVASQGGATPCGACRQVLSEFALDLPILLADTDGHVWQTSLGVLLPAAFSRAKLGDGS